MRDNINEKSMHFNKNGITLVALVITIIVLLILAGVAIRAVVGDNGVLNQATKASKKTNYKTAAEQIELQAEYIEVGENAGKVDLDKTLANINKLDLAEIDKTKEIIMTDNDITVPLTNGENVIIKGKREEQKVQTEYYTGVFNNNQELVYAVDYENNILYVYQGEENEGAGGNLVEIENIPGLEFVRETFTIIMDGESVEKTNAIGVKIDGNILFLIENGKAYEGENKDDGVKFYSEPYLTLDKNFDTSRIKKS